MLRTIAVHELVRRTRSCDRSGADDQGLKLPVEFGTAPSTLLYAHVCYSQLQLTARYRAKGFSKSPQKDAMPKSKL